jgi:hypothetical protein
VSIINESVNDLIKDIKWEKNLIAKWLKEKNTIYESEEIGLWDKIKTGTVNLASKIGNAGLEMAKTVFNKGVIPALRWIRRGLYTGVGIVIDVVVSILAAKTNAIVWFVIVLLDIYEIATGDFDPKDPNRLKTPFFFLLTDLLGCILTSAFAFAAKKALPAITKQGLEKGAPQLVGPIKTLSSKLPSVESKLISTATELELKLGPKSSGVLGRIKGFISRILTQFRQFLSKLFSKQGAVATATGAGVYVAGHAIGVATQAVDKEGKLGKSIVGFDKWARKKTGMGNLYVSPQERNSILSMAKLN